jgi:DNA-binding MarR family transcriptional regulator
VASDDELQLDRLIHEPARLAILTVLTSVKNADFTFLQRTTGLTKGNLSSHLGKLEAGGLVEITKTFIRKKPNTKVALTSTGRKRVARHWEQLERLRTMAAGTLAPPDVSEHRPSQPQLERPARRSSG